MVNVVQVRSTNAIREPTVVVRGWPDYIAFIRPNVSAISREIDSNTAATAAASGN